LILQRFPLADGMWQQVFSPHALHGSMLDAPRCGCGSMQRLFFPPQESKASSNLHKQKSNIKRHSKQGKGVVAGVFGGVVLNDIK